MKERKSFLLRMDPALYEALAAWSAQEMRSLNGQIEFLLKEAVARRHGDETFREMATSPPPKPPSPPDTNIQEQRS